MAQPLSLVSQYLRRLSAHLGDPSTDHELLQRFVANRNESVVSQQRCQVRIPRRFLKVHRSILAGKRGLATLLRHHQGKTPH